MITYKNLVYTDDTFEICTDIEDRTVEKIILHENCKEIDQRTFEYMPNLKTVILNKNLKTMGVKAFASCHELSNINLEDTNLQKIGMHAFCGCNKLKKIKFPDTISLIGSYAFYLCDFKNIDLSNTKIKTIEKFSFESNKNLETVLFPDTLKQIKANSFRGCQKLENLDLKNIETIDFTAFAYTNIKELIFPDALRNIFFTSSEKPPLEKIIYGKFPYAEDKEDFQNYVKQFYPNIEFVCTYIDLDKLLAAKTSFKQINNIYKENNYIKFS